jgi:hypothetical protein
LPIGAAVAYRRLTHGSEAFIVLQHPPNIAFAVQNSHDAQPAALQDVVDADHIKTLDPAKIEG